MKTFIVEVEERVVKTYEIKAEKRADADLIASTPSKLSELTPIDVEYYNGKVTILTEVKEPVRTP